MATNRVFHLNDALLRLAERELTEHLRCVRYAGHGATSKKVLQLLQAKAHLTQIRQGLQATPKAELLGFRKE